MSVTEAARGFSDLINRVRYRNESAVLVKNGTPVARIIPFVSDPPRPTAADLARRLMVLQLQPDDANRFMLLTALTRNIMNTPPEEPPHEGFPSD